MKPFELSMDFLLKSRENRALIESLLDRMEGAELNLDEIMIRAGYTKKGADYIIE